MPARCYLTTYVAPATFERLEAEAERRGVTRTALAREVIERAFPAPPEPAPVVTDEQEEAP